MKNIEFKGTGSEYFKIWIVNVLLCIVTLGIYYPWAKVRNKRYFYANTGYDNRYFDYHATGKQLFLGYLIAVGMLIVFNIIMNFVPLLGAALFIGLFVAIPWIIWRSLQFNMRMTSFSNVRFGFIGELKTSYLIYMLIPVVGYLAIILIIFAFLSVGNLMQSGSSSTAVMIVVLIIGLIGVLALSVYMMSLLTKKASEYQIGNTKFGQGNFSVNIDTGTFIKITLKALLIYSGIVLIFAAIFSVIFGSAFSDGFDIESLATDANPSLMTSLMLMYIGFVAATLFAAAYTYSRQRQYLYANTTLDDSITFKSTVTAKKFFYVLLTNMLITLFSLGLALPWTKVRITRYIAENTWIEATDIDINSYLTQKENEQSAIGEEIGDVLDVDISIAI